LKFRSLPRQNHIGPHVFISPYGQFLRKWSLDELPSILNILKGDVSLVGPRPLMVDFFCPEWRNSMRPGMTGLAQIQGRNNIGWREKFRYDLFYTRHASFGLDLYILCKTIPLLFSTQGTALPSPEDYFPTPEDDCAKRSSV
jgi:sugar transferase EpsL